MRMTFLSAALAGGLSLAAGSAMADEPTQLTAAQMDGVTAGAAFFGIGGAVGVGNLVNISAGTQLGAAFGNNAFVFGDFSNVTASVLTPGLSISGQLIQASN